MFYSCSTYKLCNCIEQDYNTGAKVIYNEDEKYYYVYDYRCKSSRLLKHDTIFNINDTIILKDMYRVMF